MWAVPLGAQAHLWQNTAASLPSARRSRSLSPPCQGRMGENVDENLARGDWRARQPLPSPPQAPCPPLKPPFGPSPSKTPPPLPSPGPPSGSAPSAAASATAPTPPASASAATGSSPRASSTMRLSNAASSRRVGHPLPLAFLLSHGLRFSLFSAHGGRPPLTAALPRRVSAVSARAGRGLPHPDGPR